MATVRAKFRITKLEETWGMVPKGIDAATGKQQWGEGKVVTIVGAPVYGNGDPNHENTKFWHATPSGEFRLGTVNEAAAAIFLLGREVYVDFTPVTD